MAIICLDPGHGGIDPGAVYGSAYEKEIALNTSFFANHFLRKAGHSILMTRKKDIFVKLSSRVRIAEYQKADLFISVHCNANRNKKYHGMAVHVSKHPSMGDLNLASYMEKTMIQMFPDHSHRGIKKSNFQVLTYTKMPSVMVETEFLSNKEGRKFLIKVQNQKRLGRCIADGAMRYIRHLAE